MRILERYIERHFMIELIEERIKLGAGCTKGEYIAAVEALENIRPLNLLVFSCGMDSVIWEKLADNVLFVEDIPGWAARISKEIKSKIILVKYTTKAIDGIKYVSKDQAVDISCLDCLSEFTPNAIFIDGPIGYGGGPGRMAPMKWASLQPGIEKILVHDFHRQPENVYSTALFKDNYNLTNSVEKLGVFTRKERNKDDEEDV